MTLSLFGDDIRPEGSRFEEVVAFLLLRQRPSTRDVLSPVVKGAYRGAEYCAADYGYGKRPGWMYELASRRIL